MSGFLFLLTNACTLLTLCYAAIKLQNKLGAFERIAAPLMAGTASILLILQPLPFGEIDFDLRALPLILTGLRYGYPISMLSAIPPLTYSYLMVGGSYEAIATLRDIIIPCVISSFMYSSEQSGHSIISLHRSWQMSAILFAAHWMTGWYISHSLTLPLHSAISVAAISGLFLAVLIMMSNEENRTWLMQRSLQLKANQDNLTGLPNLRSFMEIAERTIQKHPAAILMVDIDNFKEFNDRWGHPEGDRLLREVGQRLMQQIGDRDYIARYGGEEFIILSPTNDLAYLSGLSRKLCDEISRLSLDYPITAEEITISVGLSTTTDKNEGLTQLIIEADEALYESKHSGKNRFTLHRKLSSWSLALDKKVN
ncbi:Probable diguanylate cyclase YcdT [Chlamydia abortus]|nr:Probable diguanylate cyclase YcdT [Chlamydia abortus]